MASKIPAHLHYQLWTGGIDISTDTIKMLAIASAGAVDPGASEYDDLADISAILAHEPTSMTNYARQTLSITVTEDDGNGRAKIDAADITITDLGNGDATPPDIEGWIIYKDGATDADRVVLGWFEYASPQPVTGNDFTIEVAALGLFLSQQG